MTWMRFARKAHRFCPGCVSRRIEIRGGGGPVTGFAIANPACPPLRPAPFSRDTALLRPHRPAIHPGTLRLPSKYRVGGTTSRSAHREYLARSAISRLSAAGGARQSDARRLFASPHSGSVDRLRAEGVGNTLIDPAFRSGVFCG